MKCARSVETVRVALLAALLSPFSWGGQTTASSSEGAISGRSVASANSSTSP